MGSPGARSKARTNSATFRATAYPAQRRLSTGSSWAARAAGTVPKITPTTEDTMMAMTADQPLIGTRYSVKGAERVRDSEADDNAGETSDD